jgi:hypothetical protein
MPDSETSIDLKLTELPEFTAFLDFAAAVTKLGAERDDDPELLALVNALRNSIAAAKADESG